MTRAYPTRWFVAAFAVGVLAASLVTCSRCCKAEASEVEAFRVAVAQWRAARS